MPLSTGDVAHISGQSAQTVLTGQAANLLFLWFRIVMLNVNIQRTGGIVLQSWGVAFEGITIQGVCYKLLGWNIIKRY